MIHQYSSHIFHTNSELNVFLTIYPNVLSGDIMNIEYAGLQLDKLEKTDIHIPDWQQNIAQFNLLLQSIN